MGGRAPHLRYPLWRWTAMWLTIAVGTATCIVTELRRRQELRRQRWEKFFKNYDPYEHMKEICSHEPGIMHACPKDLAIAYKEAGLK